MIASPELFLATTTTSTTTTTTTLPVLTEPLVLLNETTNSNFSSSGTDEQTDMAIVEITSGNENSTFVIENQSNLTDLLSNLTDSEANTTEVFVPEVTFLNETTESLPNTTTIDIIGVESENMTEPVNETTDMAIIEISVGPSENNTDKVNETTRLDETMTTEPQFLETNLNATENSTGLPETPEFPFGGNYSENATVPLVNTVSGLNFSDATTTGSPENVTEYVDFVLLNETITIPEDTFNTAENMTQLFTENPLNENLTGIESTTNGTLFNETIIEEVDMISNATNESEIQLQNETANFTTAIAGLILNTTEEISLENEIPELNSTGLRDNDTTDNDTGVDGFGLPLEIPDGNFTEPINATTTEPTVNSTDNITDLDSMPTEIPLSINLTEPLNKTTPLPPSLNETDNATNIFTFPIATGSNATDNTSDMLILPIETDFNTTENTTAGTTFPLESGLNMTDNATIDGVTAPTELSFNETDNTTSEIITLPLETGSNETDNATGIDLLLVTTDAMLSNDSDSTNLTANFTPDPKTSNNTENGTVDLVDVPTVFPEFNSTVMENSTASELNNTSEITLPVEFTTDTIFNSTENGTTTDEMEIPTQITMLNSSQLDNTTDETPTLFITDSPLNATEYITDFEIITDRTTTMQPEVSNTTQDFNNTITEGIVTDFPVFNDTEIPLIISTENTTLAGDPIDGIEENTTTFNPFVTEAMQNTTDLPSEVVTFNSSLPLEINTPGTSETNITSFTQLPEMTTLPGQDDNTTIPDTTTFNQFVTEAMQNTTDLPSEGMTLNSSLPIESTTPDTSETNITNFTQIPEVTTWPGQDDNMTVPDIGTPPPFNQRTTLIDDNDTTAPINTTTTSAANVVTVTADPTAPEVASTSSPWPSTSSTTSETPTTKPTTTPKTTTTTTTPKPVKPIAELKADPANQPQKVSFKLEGDFNTIVGSNIEGAKNDIARQLATIMNIDVSRIQNLELSPGKTIVIQYFLYVFLPNSAQIRL